MINLCTQGYNGAEVLVENFEVLKDDNRFVWEPASDGRVATGAVSTGRDGNDEIYIGRAPFQGSMTIGKVNRVPNLEENHLTLYINSRFIPLIGVCTSPTMARKSERLTTKCLCTRDPNVSYS